MNHWLCTLSAHVCMHIWNAARPECSLIPECLQLHSKSINPAEGWRNENIICFRSPVFKGLMIHKDIQYTRNRIWSISRSVRLDQKLFNPFTAGAVICGPCGGSRVIFGCSVIGWRLQIVRHSKEWSPLPFPYETWVREFWDTLCHFRLNRESWGCLTFNKQRGVKKNDVPLWIERVERKQKKNFELLSLSLIYIHLANGDDWDEWLTFAKTPFRFVIH